MLSFPHLPSRTRFRDGLWGVDESHWGMCNKDMFQRRGGGKEREVVWTDTHTHTHARTSRRVRTHIHTHTSRGFKKGFSAPLGCGSAPASREDIPFCCALLVPYSALSFLPRKSFPASKQIVLGTVRSVRHILLMRTTTKACVHRFLP